MPTERIFRIGEKLISLDKATRHIERAFELREQGYAQQEAARRLQLDRSFISRLESIGEIRKGDKVAVIAFPIANAAELSAICSACGLDFYLILNNEQRWEMVLDSQALDFFNRMLALVTRLRELDTLIMVTSGKWHHLAEALLDIQIVYISLGATPIESDCHVNPEQFQATLAQVLEQQGRENESVEACGRG